MTDMDVRCAVPNHQVSFALQGFEMPQRRTRRWTLALVHGEAIDLLRDQERPSSEPVGETQLNAAISSVKKYINCAARRTRCPSRLDSIRAAISAVYPAR